MKMNLNKKTYTKQASILFALILLLGVSGCSEPSETDSMEENLSSVEEIRLYELAERKMEAASSFKIETSGEVDPNIPLVAKQSLLAHKIKSGESYYNYTASKGTASTFFEMYGTNGSGTLKTGTKLSKDLLPESVDEVQEITINQFINIYGSKPYELHYIINEDSVLAISDSTSNEDGHQFTLTLHNELATSAYKKHIVATNTLQSEAPNFTSIKLVVEIDANGYFKAITYHEAYSIRIKLPVFGYSTQSIKAEIVDTFSSYNEPLEITPFKI